MPQKKSLNLQSRAQSGRPGAYSQPKDQAFNYVPSPRQTVFHSCNADVVLYGGAAGGGKSKAILAEAYAVMRETPGGYGVLMRRSYPELERSLILESKRLFPRGHCRYNELQHRWTIRPEGGGPDSVLEFSYCRTPKEALELYKSAEFVFLGVDEATQNEWETLKFLMSRSRTSIKGAKARIVFTTNPGGVSHVEIKKYFGIGVIQPETIFTPEPDDEDIMPLSRCFIPAKLADNPYLMDNDPGYIKKLALLPTSQRRMLMDGNWDVFEGRFFPEFGKQNIVEPFDIPAHWKIYRSVDYGFSAPFCCLWFAAAPDGHYYVFRELYLKGLRDKEQALLIRQSSTEKVEYTTGDPSMRNKNASGVSPAENYQNTAGILVYPSSNERPSGWMACRNMLAHHPDGTPIMKVFQSCKNLIGEIEAAICSEKAGNTDDINIHSRRDHALDAWRYFAVSRPLLPVEAEPDPFAHLDPTSRREWMSVTKRQNEIANGNNEATLHGINYEEDSDFF